MLSICLSYSLHSAPQSVCIYSKSADNLALGDLRTPVSRAECLFVRTRKLSTPPFPLFLLNVLWKFSENPAPDCLGLARENPTSRSLCESELQVFRKKSKHYYDE